MHQSSGRYGSAGRFDDKQIVRHLPAQRDPDLILILLHIADHLLQRAGYVGAPAKFGMHDHVHGAHSSAQCLLVDEINEVLKPSK